MKEAFDIIQVGLGPMGRIIAKLMIERQNLNLVSVVDLDPKLSGKPINKVLDISNGSNIIIESNLDSVLSNIKADVVFIATSSSLEEVAPIIQKAVNNMDPAPGQQMTKQLCSAGANAIDINPGP